jgi:uncharacterized membrane-anchored protein YitT (DUF2179 family)
MQAQGRVAYYLSTGGLMGMGIAAIFSIGLAIFLLGLVLALYGLKRIGPAKFWLTLVGMGAAPALLFLYDYLVLNDSAIEGPDAYLYVALVFLLISLAGAVWGIAEGRRSHNSAEPTLKP